MIEARPNPAPSLLCVDPAGSAPAPGEAVLGALRRAIARIERPVADLQGPGGADSSQKPLWQLGCPVADWRLPEGGLATAALHEVKGRALLSSGASAADWMAAFGFALRLAVRRLDALQAQDSGVRPFLLWCWPRALAGEFGRPSAAGLLQLGLDPARILFVETARAGDTLAALEEGLRSASLGLAAGVIEEAGLTPARRLSLAAAAGATPGLLITHPKAEAAAATVTRWRIGRAPSAPHPFDAKAPGPCRFVVEIERCRASRRGAGLAPLLVEWSDEAHRFSVSAGLADNVPCPQRAAGGAAR